MKIYEILDEENGFSVGILLYYEKDAAFIAELREELDEWTAPLLFTAYVKRGIYTVPREITLLWVRQRIIPSGRQNIQSILETHHMESYDELRFLEKSSGRCAQDSLYIRPLDTLPEYVRRRQERNLADAAMLGGGRVLCLFSDGSTRLTVLESLENTEKILKNEELFLSGQVGPGGYCLTFNDSIDIPAGQLYTAGTALPLRTDDFRRFVQNNVLTTTAGCALLSCSRQNLSYLAGTGQIDPLISEGSTSLYQKGDLLKTRW